MTESTLTNSSLADQLLAPHTFDYYLNLLGTKRSKLGVDWETTGNPEEEKLNFLLSFRWASPSSGRNSHQTSQWQKLGSACLLWQPEHQVTMVRGRADLLHSAFAEISTPYATSFCGNLLTGLHDFKGHAASIGLPDTDGNFAAVRSIWWRLHHTYFHRVFLPILFAKKQGFTIEREKLFAVRNPHR